jgi:hypothetical protein
MADIGRRRCNLVNLSLRLRSDAAIAALPLNMGWYQIYLSRTKQVPGRNRVLWACIVYLF